MYAVQVFTSWQSPPQPARLRHCNAAAFASVKILATLELFTADYVVTEPNEAAYAPTGEGKEAPDP
ncbi:MAG: hypothetical protein V4725_08150 [Bacteroidota bacterium]|nr:hypothetical protein [Ferruginibacter sp.]